MEQKDDTATTSPNPEPLKRFSGIDLCTWANALREHATEAKRYCLCHPNARGADFQAFLENTDKFVILLQKAWEAIRVAIAEDTNDLNLYKILEDRADEKEGELPKGYPFDVI